MTAVLRRAVLAALASAALVAPAMAAADLGPPVGAKAPGIGAPPDQTGKARRLKDLQGPRGVVLLFFRSAAWCPFCQAQLIEMNGVAGDIAGRGYRLVGLSYDSPAVLAAFTERRQIGFPLLSDPKSAVIDRYGLRDPQYPPDSKAYGVPRPIILVIDAKVVIRAKLFEETYRTRPPAALVLATLDGLGASGRAK